MNDARQVTGSYRDSDERDLDIDIWCTPLRRSEHWMLHAKGIDGRDVTVEIDPAANLTVEVGGEARLGVINDGSSGATLVLWDDPRVDGEGTAALSVHISRGEE